MRIHPRGHHRAVRRGQRRRRPWRPWRTGGRRPVAIGTDAVGSVLGVGGILGAERGAVEQMLLLATGVLCANLLAIDALHRETLQENRKRQYEVGGNITQY